MATRQGIAYGPHTTDSAPLPTSSQLNVEADNRSKSSENLIDDDGNSSVSRISRQSSLSSVRARARAEAAKAKLQFARKQADLEKHNAENEAQLEAQKSKLSSQQNTRKVHFEADMAVLQAEQEAASATAEEMVYESAELSDEILLDPTLLSVQQRTEEYVESCTLPGISEKMAYPFYTREDPPLLHPIPAKVEDQLASQSKFQFPALGSGPLSSQPQVTQVRQVSPPSLHSVPTVRTVQQPEFASLLGGSVPSNVYSWPQLSKLHPSQLQFLTAPSRLSPQPYPSEKLPHGTHCPHPSTAAS